jgi:hypothetical protein
LSWRSLSLAMSAPSPAAPTTVSLGGKADISAGYGNYTPDSGHGIGVSLTANLDPTQTFEDTSTATS